MPFPARDVWCKSISQYALNEEKGNAEMDYAQMTAPCGLDCFNCPMYLADENQKLKGAIAEHLKIPLEKAVCKGCRNENGTIGFLDMTEPCGVYKCIEQKKIAFCCHCSDFPCDYLHPYADRADEVPHNTKVFNLCLIKKMGLEGWAKEKAGSVKRTYFKGEWKI
ncbi:MAG: DUF3795 domain-containing protein [Thermodesulfobacteriota bacterium]|nr:DUF3795 domain-containing protein [Thermodesulfobacteriota bacterium]